MKRYAALDRIFVAALPLDSYDAQKDVPGDKFRADTKPLLKACDALPDDDALMRSIRSGCPLLSEVAEQGSTIDTCDSTAECQRSMRSFRSIVDRMLAVSRRGDRVVAAQKGLADECKRTLTTPPQTYSIFEGYASGVLLMERALRSPSPAALNKAEEQIAAAEKEFKARPTGKVLLERFRAGCD